MKNIIIITKDRPGIIADISEIMSEANININFIDSEQINNTAVTTLSVDKIDDALLGLAHSEFHALVEDTILIKLEDKPGSLASVAKRFKNADINMHSLRLIRRDAGIAFVAISCKEQEKATKLVEDLLLIKSQEKNI